MKSPLRLRQLEALKAVADHGSMTRAASELGITQPAVSRLLSDLGDELGFALLDRRDGRLVPSQEARYLLPDIQRILDMMARLSETSRAITEKRAGHIRIACLPGFATSHLPSVVADFLRHRPGVSVTIEPDRPERILEWMIGEDYDFGITDSFEGHPAVDSQRVDIRSVCIFPEGHWLADRETVGPSDLAGEPIIHTRRDSGFFKALSDAFLTERVALTSRIETRQFTAACELVLRGLGVSVISELDAAQYASRGLQSRPFRPRIPHQLSLVRPILKPASMITLDFIESFAASLAPFRQD
ncbi:LysR substrate-binding domain-containing protein [Cognatishimia sp. F0-27]|uniref:LysR substrate-binding domain-containing protein n=1 Tax=Cognatishimia sp. F0-27 TaxID=2816855 RepID=UPI001D0C872F|nr:LysR substrate-binding domain-containing protein [Cognatishimia sp. F0-27]MCC1494867.1 LysR family transcriptional regulator [Cognatishimia sp. F0-27]